MRCLCGDDNPPINGQCQSKKKGNICCLKFTNLYNALIYFFQFQKGFRHLCNGEDQCDEGMICTTDNSTKTVALGFRNNAQPKLCLCDENEGYTEENNECSGRFHYCLIFFMNLFKISNVFLEYFHF